jgi:hypothetical protein
MLSGVDCVATIYLFVTSLWVSVMHERSARHVYMSRHMYMSVGLCHYLRHERHSTCIVSHAGRLCGCMHMPSLLCYIALSSLSCVHLHCHCFYAILLPSSYNINTCMFRASRHCGWVPTALASTLSLSRCLPVDASPPMSLRFSQSCYRTVQ